MVQKHHERLLNFLAHYLAKLQVPVLNRKPSLFMLACSYGSFGVRGTHAAIRRKNQQLACAHLGAFERA